MHAQDNSQRQVPSMQASFSIESGSLRGPPSGRQWSGFANSMYPTMMAGSERSPDRRESTRSSLDGGATGRSSHRQSIDASRFYVPPEAARNSRLVPRDRPFNQCSGEITLSQTWPAEVSGLIWKDWYHTALALRTRYLLFIFVMVYTGVILFYAWMYVLVDSTFGGCGIALDDRGITFHTAFSFSLETMTTIGYGLPPNSSDGGGDAFFSGCAMLPTLVWSQSLLFLIMNAMWIGLVYSRIGRADKRANLIVFSDKAVIRVIRDKFFFMFQVAELSLFKYKPVVEAHVRCYAVFHEKRGGSEEEGSDSGGGRAPQFKALFQHRVMRLTNPNDELGACLFLATPTTVTHRIDQWSPLFTSRPTGRPSRNISATPFSSSSLTQNDMPLSHQTPANRYFYPGIVLRASDCDTFSRDCVACPVCGETFASTQYLIRHIEYAKIGEAQSGYKKDDTSAAGHDLQQLMKNGYANGYGMKDCMHAPSPGRKQGLTRNFSHTNIVGGNMDCLMMQQPPQEQCDYDDISAAVFYSSDWNSKSSPGRKQGLTRNFSHTNIVGGNMDCLMMQQPPQEQCDYDEVSAAQSYYSDTQRFPPIIDDTPRNSIDIISTDVDKQDTSHLASPPRANVSRKMTNAAPLLHLHINTGTPPPSTVEGTPHPQTPKPAASAASGKQQDEQSPNAMLKSAQKVIRDHIRDSQVEIVILLEGIDPHSSNTFQARHSYKGDDIQFDKTFVPCLVYTDDGKAQVDFHRFHDLTDVPFNVAEIEPTSSHA